MIKISCIKQDFGKCGWKSKDKNFDDWGGWKSRNTQANKLLPILSKKGQNMIKPKHS